MKQIRETGFLSREIALAYEQFVIAAQTDKKLGLLFLIDPLQAFSDAGIKLSKVARKKIRRNYPTDAAKSEPLYAAVQGQESTPYLKCVDVRLVKPVR